MVFQVDSSEQLLYIVKTTPAGSGTINSMRIIALYHPQSEAARTVEEYVRDFGRRNSKPIELISLETRAGADLAKLYDIVQYPAIMVISDDGQVQKGWLGERLPLMDEVAGYITA